MAFAGSEWMTYIKYRVALGNSASDIHNELQNVLAEKSPPFEIVEHMVKLYLPAESWGNRDTNTCSSAVDWQPLVQNGSVAFGGDSRSPSNAGAMGGVGRGRMGHIRNSESSTSPASASSRVGAESGTGLMANSQASGGSSHNIGVSVQMPCDSVQGNYAFKCHNCREFGHKAKQCPLPAQRFECHYCQSTEHKVKDCPDLANKTCRMCGKKGHTERYCPNKHNDF